MRDRSGLTNRASRCSVSGCTDEHLVVVAGDEKATTLMCSRHAMAWTQSSGCRDVAQHNSGAAMGSLLVWLTARS